MKSYLAHSTYANPFTHLPLYANVIWDAFITYFDAFSALTWGGERELKDLMLWAINNSSCTPETCEVSFLKKMWWAALKGQNSKGGTQGAPLLVPSTHSHSTQNMALQVPALWTKHLVYNGTPGTALEVSIFVRAEGHFPCSPEVFRRPFSLPTSPFGTQYFSPVICRRKLDPCLQHGLVCHSYRKHFRRQFSVSICLLTRQ